MFRNRYFVEKNNMMDATRVRQKIHEYVDNADERFLTLVNGMIEADLSQDYELSEEQQQELDKRLEKYEAGKMNFSSWDTVKNRIRNNTKNAL